MTSDQENKQKTHLNQTKALEVEAKSLEQALVKAAGILGVTQDELDYKVVKEDSPKGLFSFFKNPSVTISAQVKGVTRGPNFRKNEKKFAPHQKTFNTAPKPTSRRIAQDDDEDTFDHGPDRSHEPLSQDKVESLTGELKDFCAGMIQRISGEDPLVTSKIEDGRLILTSENEFLGQQIMKNTKLAEAMEHILRKKPRHLKQELPFRIFVDVGGMRKKREEELIQMALDLSVKVHENRRPIVLNYKSSYDRKIIHMALDKDERVYTKSIGSGPNRKLMILPNKYSQGEADADRTQPPQVINVD